ncbi:MAG: amino acid ABC transporter ATP-binding protein [Verrucomicrobiales bacterium]|nr:amino acid ABC transporter ATP-binding protein [Verrucomicrobiales bacterium]
MKVSAQHVDKLYGESIALRGVDFATADDTQVLVLIGPSGGGKSTLLRLLGGLESPTRGDIFHESTLLVQQTDPLRSFRRKNGFLFQAFNLFPHLTALQNIMLPIIHVHGQEAAAAKEVALSGLERFQLADHAEKRPAELSGGQQQRVALARSMAHDPDLLILDEPTSALDPEMKAEVLDVIEELVEAGQKIIFSTHEMGFAKAAADEVLFLAEGSVIAQGNPTEIFDNPPDERVGAFFSRVMKW